MSSRGHGPKYTPGEEIEEMKIELEVMYGKYEQLCKAYKRLAQDLGNAPKGPIDNITANFGDWEKEKDKNNTLGGKYGN